MTLDLDALQRAAEAATPGERLCDAKQGLVYVYEARQTSNGRIGCIMNAPRFLAQNMSAADAEFTVAANPTAVLELLSRLGDRTKDVQELDERVIKLTSERDAVLADTVKLVDQLAELKAEVREWLCAECNTVYPGPPQPGVSCVICQKCGGNTGPRQTMEKRLAVLELVRRLKAAEFDAHWSRTIIDSARTNQLDLLERAEKAEAANHADLTDAESTLIYENASEDGWCSHDVADKALHALFNRVMAARRAAQGGSHG